MSEKLSDIIGPYACIWEVENGDDPYESMRSRLKDKASYLDGEDLIMENYDDEEDEEDGGDRLNITEHIRKPERRRLRRIRRSTPDLSRKPRDGSWVVRTTRPIS